MNLINPILIVLNMKFIMTIATDTTLDKPKPSN